MHILLNTLLIFLSISLISSCSKVDSDDLKSSGFNAVISAEAEGDGNTLVEARFYTGSDLERASIELSSEDELIVSADGTRYFFREESVFLEETSYEATINTDTGGTELTVSLVRRNDTSAPSSVVTLPEGMTFNMPAMGTAFHSGESITANWTPAVLSAELEIDYDILCVHSLGGNIRIVHRFDIPDSGIFAINVDYLLAGKDINQSFVCSATITLTRTNTGVLDPNYGKGGSIQASQVREVSVSIDPS